MQQLAIAVQSLRKMGLNELQDLGLDAGQQYE